MIRGFLQLKQKRKYADFNTFKDKQLKNQFNFKKIIQILQPIVIDYLSPHLYMVDFS